MKNPYDNVDVHECNIPDMNESELYADAQEVGTIDWFLKFHIIIILSILVFKVKSSVAYENVNVIQTVEETDTSAYVSDDGGYISMSNNTKDMVGILYSCPSTRALQ